MTIDLGDIKRAARTLEGQIVATPCLRSDRLSELLGATLILKYENFQHSSSFKDRGALVRLEHLDSDARRRGVIAMSAGNHAQGVAYHATRLNIPATVVMPRLTPSVKVEKTTRFGATAVLEGETVDEAAIHAHKIARERNLTFVHPYDDPLIIAGQGTIGLEMLRDAPELDILVVPIGGGGLISGIAIAAKAIKPSIEIIGVQAAACPAVHRQLKGEEPQPPRPTIAEGIAVKTPGTLTMPIIKRLVGDVVLVEEQALEEAILSLLEIERTVIEGAGAAGLAAVMSNPSRFRGKNVGLVLCGGNIDLRLLSEVILRGMVRSRRLIELQVGVADAPGSLAQISSLIAEAGGNIVQVDHLRAFSSLSVKSTELRFIIETRNASHVEALCQQLRDAGFPVTLLHEDG